MTSQPTTVRKHTRRVLVRRVLKSVVAHPSNHDRPVRAIAAASLWQLRRRLGRQPIKVRAYGFDLELPRSSGSLSNFMYFGEYFEWEAIHFLRSYLRTGDRVVDGGANVGMFTYASLEMIGASGEIDIFEPLPWAADTIERNLTRSGISSTWRLHRAAVSSESGIGRFTADLDVSSHIEFGDFASYSVARIEVPLVRIDESVPGGFIHLLKLDVEGSEHLALLGLHQLLESGSPAVLLIEAHDHSLRKMGSSRQEVLDLLESYGYLIKSFDADSCILTDHDPASGADLLAIHSSSAEMVASRLTEVRSSVGR